MPHECTTCGRTFADGSKQMLSGCPGCGGNKFQYHPGAVSEESSETGNTVEETATVEDSTATAEGSIDSSFEFGSSATSSLGDEPSVADEAGSGDVERSDDERSDDERSDDEDRWDEDRAQASARSTIVSEEELALSSSVDVAKMDTEGPESDAAESTPDSDDAGTPTAEGTPSTSLSELREELNEQFESIKIHDRGEYELNLMELYDREEHIVALQEDGRYVIDVPHSWREEDESG